MKIEEDSSVKFLLDSTEEEFGSGGELATTGYLVFGLISFWIYTVWQYHKHLKSHLCLRHKHFNKALKAQGIPKDGLADLSVLETKSFRVKNYPRNISMGFYFMSMLIIILIYVVNVFVFDNISVDSTAASYSKMGMIAICLAAFFFCAASIYFLSWVCLTLKDHELHELFCERFIRDPDNFQITAPSSTFTKRWNNNLNQIAFFLILSIPLCVSPVFAVKHFNDMIMAGQNLGGVIYFWFIVLFVSAAVFHLWGTKLLISMYNSHLRIETVNKYYLDKSSKWISGETTTVIAGTNEVAEKEKTGALVPIRSLSAIMLTDMVGFSKEMERDENTTYDKLLKHNEIIRRCISGWNGKEIKTIGDAFLLRFKSAVDSVSAAIKIQNEMNLYNNTKAETEKILIRIGIHVGDILLMDNDVLGNGVNIAARIEPLADPGGICISADVYNAVKKSVDIKTVNLGYLELKNIKDSPEIYKIVVDAVRQK